MRPNDAAARRIRRCLSTLLAVQPFFGHLALRMPVQPDATRQTLGADGETIYYNPEWILDTPADSIKAAIAHVVLACSLHHHTRRGDRKYPKWQQASQLATLPLLRDAGILDAPGGMDEAVERIYDQLPDGDDDDQNGDQPNAGTGAAVAPAGGDGDPQDGDGKGQQNGGQEPSHDPTGGGEIMDAPRHAGEHEAQQEERLKAQEQEWDEARQQALQASTAAGKRPGQIAETLEAAHSHDMDWRALLERYMRSVAERDYSWSRPNRRFIDSGLYLPSLSGVGMGPIALAIDTSGSMNSRALQQVWGEIRALAQDVEPDEIQVISCDTKVNAIERFTDAHDLPETIVAKGRGGTMYAPAFDAIRELPDPAVVVYFTDLHCFDYGEQPNAPVIWCVQPNGATTEPPFGDVVRMPR